jgi:transaldolase
LWASTSTKDRAYSDVKYVEELIGPDTVNTMPRTRSAHSASTAECAGTLDLGVDEAQRVLERFAKAGVDYDDVYADARARGVRGFEKSFDELLAGIEERNAA